MLGRTVSSQYYDLGEVAPTWHSPEFDRTFAAKATFTTDVLSGSPAVVYMGDLMVRKAVMLDSRRMEDPDQEHRLIDHLQAGVARIDELYRAYRNTPADTFLNHSVGYRVGRLRNASWLHMLTGNVLPFSGPGLSHFDGFLADDKERVIVNHRGRPTRIFTGPTRKFGPQATFSGAASKLFVPASVIAPQDRAILIDNDTLHQQSAQFYPRRNPGALLLTTISVVEPKPSEEQATDDSAKTMEPEYI